MRVCEFFNTKMMRSVVEDDNKTKSRQQTERQEVQVSELFNYPQHIREYRYHFLVPKLGLQNVTKYPIMSLRIMPSLLSTYSL